MQLQSVASSHIDAVGYEDGNLFVAFKDGSLYRYYDVPKSVYDGLMSASSHGEYLASHVKGKYRYAKIN